MNFFNRRRNCNTCNICHCGCRCGYCVFPTPIYLDDCCGNTILAPTLNPAGASATVVVPNIIL